MNRSIELPILGQPKASQTSIAVASSSFQTRQAQSILLPSSVNQPTLCMNSMPSAMTPLTSAVISNPQSTGSVGISKSVNLVDVAQHQKVISLFAGNPISTADGIFQYPGQNSITIVQNNVGHFPTTAVFQEQNQTLQSNIGIVPQLPTQTIVLPEVGNVAGEQIQYALVAADNNEGAYLVPASSIITTKDNVEPSEVAKNPESIIVNDLNQKTMKSPNTLSLEVKLDSGQVLSSIHENAYANKQSKPPPIGQRKGLKTKISLENSTPQINEVTYIVEGDGSFQLPGKDLNSASIISDDKIADGSILEVISLDESGNICEIRSQENKHIDDENSPTKISQVRKDEVIQKPIGNGPYFCEICRKKFEIWSALKKHEKEHENDKRYSCPDCNATFNLKKNLTLHIASHKTSNFECPECGATNFKRLASFKSHLAVHQEEDNLACPECEMEFTNEARLDEHMVNEHNSKTEILVKKCGSKSTNSELDKTSKVVPKIKIRYGPSVVPSNEALSTEKGATKNLSSKPQSKNRNVRQSLLLSPKKVFNQKCSQCGLAFDSLKDYNDHKKQHTVLNTLLKPKQKRHKKGRFRKTAYRNKCKYCDKTFPKPSQCERHERIHTGVKPFKCTECSSCFNQKNSLEIHMRKHTGDKPYTCEICQMGFTQNGNLRAHILRTHFVTSEEEQNVLKCEECPCVFKKVGTLNAHVSKFHSNMKRDSRLVDVDNNPDNNSESTNINKPRNDLLSQALVSTGLEEIRSTANKRTEEEEQRSISEDDEKGVMVLADKDKHGRITKHLVKIRRGPDGVKLSLCNFCDREFKKPSDLCRHLRLHTLEKPFKCKFCTRAFSNKITLNSHLRIHGSRSVDSRVKFQETQSSTSFTLSCFRCPNKKFDSRSGWRAHLKLHENKCTSTAKSSKNDNAECNKNKFNQTDESSEGVHGSIESDKNEIKHDKLSLAEPYVITSHGLIQTLPRHRSVYQPTSRELLERPFKCESCPARFKKSAHLKQHKLRHTGEKPFLCKSCQKSFVSRSTLNAHIKTHLQDQAYQCGECSMTFTTASSVRRHMARHRDERPFLCPYCQKTFKTNVLCKKHMKIHKSDVELGLTVDMNSVSTSLDQKGEISEERKGIIDITSITPNLQSNINQTNEGEMVSPARSRANEILQENVATNAPILSLNPNNNSGQTGQQAFHSANSNSVLLQTSLGSIMVPKTNATQDMISFQTSRSFSNQATAQANSTNAVSVIPHISNNGAIIVQNTPLGIKAIPGTSLLQQQSQTDNAKTTALQSTPDSVQSSIQLPLLKEKIGHSSPEFSLGSNTTKSLIQTGNSSRMPVTNLNKYVVNQTQKTQIDTINQPIPNFGFQPKVMRHSVTFADNVFHCTREGCDFTSNSADGLCNHVESTHAPPTDDDPMEANGLQSTINMNSITGDIVPANVSDTKRKTKDIISMRLTKEQEQVLTKVLPDKAKTMSEKLLLASIAEKERTSVMKTLEEEVKERSQFPNKCTLCGKGFKKPSDLVRHIRTHTGEKPFACDTCEKSFSVRSTLEVHKRIHTGKFPSFKCHVCNLSTFTSKSALKTHLRLHTGAKPYLCPFKECKERFRTSGHRKVHIANVHGGSHKFGTQETADTAAKTKTVEDIPISSSDNQSISALVPISIPAASLSQALQSVGNNGQSLIGASVRLQLHGSGLDNTFAQFQVDEGLLQQISRGESINIAINPMDLQPPHQSGSSENQSSNTSSKTPSNFIKAGENSNRESQPEKTKSIDQIRAELANNNGILKNYIDNKTEIRTLQDQDFKILTIPIVKEDGTQGNDQSSGIATGGDISSAAVTEITTLDEVSTGVIDIDGLKDMGQVFLCSACNQVFPDKERDAHFSEVHGVETELSLQSTSVLQSTISKKVGPNPSTPSVISINQKSNSSIQDQTKSAEPSSSKSVSKNVGSNSNKSDRSCTVCGKSFLKPSQLERHMRIHTGEKPFTCGTCFKAFNQKNALKKHTLKHSGERPFVCPFCAYAFNQKGNLKTHIQRTHSEQAQQLIEKELVQTQ